jgi:DNA-binding CsgD family transcriptional regulator
MSAVRSAAFDRVVHQFYEAAALPELLPNALHELAQACGAEGAALHLSSGLQTLGTVGSVGVGELHSGFVKKWRSPQLNSHRARGLELVFRGWRGALTEQDCFTAHELERDPFHQELFVSAGYSSFAGVILAKAPGSVLSTSIIRRIDQGTYSRSEIENINVLASQLQLVGSLALRIGISSAQRIADAFASDGRPLALLRNDGRILHASESFENLMRNGLTIENRRLASWHPDASRKIAAAVKLALEYDGNLRKPLAPIILPRRNGARPMIASIIPVVGAAHDILHLVSAIVSIIDLEIKPVGPSISAMQQAFGLTLSEATLAQDIAVGKTLPEIATVIRVSKETLRSRLKSIFEKTGTSRQAELAMLLGQLPKSSSHAGH